MIAAECLCRLLPRSLAGPLARWPKWLPDTVTSELMNSAVPSKRSANRYPKLGRGPRNFYRSRAPILEVVALTD